MLAKIKQFFASMFHISSIDWWDEHYLNSAADAADLERRQRQLAAKTRSSYR